MVYSNILITILFFALTSSEVRQVPEREFDMVPIWTVRENEETGVFFGEIEDVVVSDSGEVFVLDSQLTEIKVYSSGGILDRTLGREGDGPAEFRASGFLSFFPDNSLGVVSKIIGKVKRLNSSNGNPLGEFRVQNIHGQIQLLGKIRTTSMPDHHSAVIAVITEMNSGGMWRWRKYLGMLYFNGDDSILTPEKPIREVGEAHGQDREEEDYYTLWDPWTIDSLGRIVMAPYWGKYLLEYYSIEGNLLQSVKLPFEHRERTPFEKQRLLSFGWGGTSPEAYGVEIIPAETEPVVRRIHPQTNGSCWIETSRTSKLKSGLFMEFDIISPDGALSARALVFGSGNKEVDRIFFCPNDRIIVVHGAERYIPGLYGRNPNVENYELSISCYQLVSRIK